MTQEIRVANFFRPRWILILTRAVDWPVAPDARTMLRRLDQPHRKAIIALARTLGNAYGAEVS
jgi:hypothetical protein